MRITKVRYGRTFNIGNYESVRLEAEADVEPDEHPGSTVTFLKAFIESAFEEQHAEL